MINTLLEHVPIKMEINDVEENPNKSVVARDKTAIDMAQDDEDVMETESDESDDFDEDDDDDEDDEETDLESEALEIEQAATLLISSDEEAELEAQRIRFPEILVSKKSKKDSNKTSRSSSRNSFSSNASSLTTGLISKPLTEKAKVSNTAAKDLTEKQENKQISACNKAAESNNNNSRNNRVAESVKMEDTNKNTTLLKSKAESNNMMLENVNKPKNDAENVNKTHNSIPSNSKIRRESNNSTCSVASTVASDTAETESCGNIYVFNLQQKLIFNCEFCDLKYGDLENFGRHLHKAHKLFNFDEDPEKENAPRNMHKSNKVPTKNCSNVKKEPLHISDSVTGEASSPLPPAPPVALPLSVLAEPLDSCGNVFMLNHRKLFLVCGYCECKYANLDLFEKHLRQQHRIFEGCRNEVNVVPKIEIKEEVVINTEHKEKQVDITTPEAMVAIPAEIPLDISINPENEHETLTALEEIENVEKDNSPSQVEDNNEKVVQNDEKEIENKLTNDKDNTENLVDLNSSAEKTKLKRRNSTVKPTISAPKRSRRNTAKNDTTANEETEEVPPNEEILENATTNLTVDTTEKEIPKAAPTNDINETLETPNKILKSDDVTTSEVRKTRSSVCKKSTQEDAADNKKAEKQKVKEITNVKQIISKEIETPKDLMTPNDESKTIENNAVETKKTSPKETKAGKILKKRTVNKNIKKETKEQSKKVNTDSTRTLKNITKESKEPAKNDSTRTLKNITKESKEPAKNENKYSTRTPPNKNIKKESKEQTENENKDLTKTLNKNIKKESKEQAKNENKDSTNTNNGIKDTKKSLVNKKSTTKRKCNSNNNQLESAVLIDNQIAQTELEEAELVNAEVGAESTVISCEPIVENKKPRRSIKTKVEKESTPPSATILSLPSSPPASQVEQIQIIQLPAEAVQYDENLMHDLSTDPVNDIIEQIQNEYLENEQREQANNATANTVTFTIHTVQEANSSLEDDTHNINENIIVAIKTPASDLNSPVDVKPFLIDNAKRFVCDQCPRAFKKHVRLVEHKRLHTGEKPFSCDECGKQFRIRMRLNEHKLRHSKDKKFKCDICQLACCTKQDLNLHMRHHTNDRRFQCTMCPKAFVRSSDLKIHVRVHTGEKPYVCDICNKCFRANQNLSVHKKSHMGEASKTYKCEHCDKKFMRNIDRKVHMRSHTGEKPYKCEICQRGYSSKFNVRAHIERDHMSANGKDTPPRGKKKPGPKPKALREELAKQKKLIEELQQQLLQQIRTDDKVLSSEEEVPVSDTIQDCTITPSTSIKTSSNDPIESAYELLNQLKSNATTSKPLTVIPSPPTIELSSPEAALNKTTKTPTTLLPPVTVTQKIEQHNSSASATPSTASVSCLTTSPPTSKTTATKVVSQKTSLGIQQVSVTVSMQVENVTPTPTTTPKNENAAGHLTTSSSGSSSSTAVVKKERKITSYFTVLGQKAEV